MRQEGGKTVKTEEDYKTKIKKLLALSESPNEHEARAVLLKARQLMAEHKLAETELEDPVKQKVSLMPRITFEIICGNRICN